MISTISTGLRQETISIFPRDHYQRRKLFVEDSFQHQAKSNLYQLAWILNNFTAEGDIILDPMGGTGSTLLGATMQRSVVVGEIEDHWIDILKRNRDRISKSFMFSDPMLGYQGNAMNLPFGSGVISAVVTSPPYWDTFSDWSITSKIRGRHPGPYGSGFGDDRGKEKKRNIGNIHIYEDYLRAMAIVYSEIHRVLKTDGFMVLIVKDRIQKGFRVPIIEDTIALCVAMGFSSHAYYNIQTRPSQFRTLYRQQNPDGPVIDSEAIVVMQKCSAAAPGRKIAIIEGIGPKAEHGPIPVIKFFTSPIFRKLLAYAQVEADMVYILAAKQGFISLEQNIIDFDPELHRYKAKIRREWIFDIVRDQIMKGAFMAVDKVALYGSRYYAPYLQQRLETLGCKVERPLKGMNLGRQLGWLTERGF